VVVVLVLGLVGSAMAAPTIGRLTGEERRARLAHMLGILGALVAGFGVILFFAANWSDIPRPLRVVLLLSGLVALFGAGFVLKEVRGTHPHIGHAFIFLGTVLFGASVFLVGQMYHVQAHDPLGFLLWAAGAIAMAVVVRSGPIAALGIISFFAFLIHELADASVSFDEFVVIPAFLALYGVALYGFGTGAQTWLEPIRFVRPMRMLGYGFLVAGLLPMTFRDAHEFADAERALDVNRIAVMLGCLAAAAVISAFALAILRWRDRMTAIGESVVLLGTAVLMLVALLAPEVTEQAFLEGSGQPDRATVYPILFNVALGIVAFGSVVAGLLTDEVWLANGGAVTVGVDVLARFFAPDWSMLERGVVMMLAGAGVLVLAALFERRRLQPA
jgi:uncharacterized membrane protein